MKGLDLAGFLVKPAQRLALYPLLFSDIYKLTEPGLLLASTRYWQPLVRTPDRKRRLNRPPGLREPGQACCEHEERGEPGERDDADERVTGVL